MSMPAARSLDDRPSHPLIGHGSGDDVAAYVAGRPRSAAQFLADVDRTAQALPEARRVLNFCVDRYRFAVLLFAAISRGQVTLLPPATTPNVIAAMREYAPDAYFASEDASIAVDLPRCDLPELGEDRVTRFEIPRIPADQCIATLFTSGSTGAPRPHSKTWGSLVRDMSEGSARLGIGSRHTILGTVPPQHMYGFESTVLLPLLAGAALSAERPYFPAAIDQAIERSPEPRVLFTTPFHLRTWVGSGSTARIETVVSATAPLPVSFAREAESATGAQVLEIYGCTEAGQVATRRPTAGPEWLALDGLRLWHDDGQAMVGGGHVEIPTPLQDVIEVVGDGTRFLLHGRLSDMVNIAGKRNSLGYLNHQLATIPGVVDGVFFQPDETTDGSVMRLTALVVAPKLGAEDVLAALRERIDPAFLPRPLHLVDALPREHTGKLPRAALLALAYSRKDE